MTDRELMQQALDALEGYARNCLCEGGGAPCDAAEALRARLKQPEEPDWSAAGFGKPPTHSEQWWKHEVSNAFANGYEKGRASIKQPEQEPVAWTERELELIDGMIEVQVIHAERCDSIPNRAMAEKQKGWDMERVELLRKIRTTAPPQREWQGLTEMEVMDICNFAKGQNSFFFVREIEAKLKAKNA